MTPTTTPNPNPQDPNPQQQIDPKVLAQVVDQVLASRQQPTQAQPQPQPVTLNVNGQPQTFADPNQITAAFNQKQQEIEQMRQQYQEAQAQLAQLSQQQTQPQPQTPQPPAVDMEKYIELLSKDPIAAANYIDEIRYGYNPVQVNQQALAKLIDLNNIQQANIFKDMVPEYEENQHNAEVLYQLLQRNNLAWTANNLRLAYDHAKNNGLLQTEETPQTSPYDMSYTQNPGNPYAQYQPQPQNPYAQFQPQASPYPNMMPPSIGRGNAGTFDANADIEAKFAGMSAAEMEQAIRKLENAGYR